MPEGLMQFIMIAGGILNLLLSSGVLYKLIEFARNYGVLENTVKTHGGEIDRLRTFSHDLRDGKIMLPQPKAKGATS